MRKIIIIILVTQTFSFIPAFSIDYIVTQIVEIQNIPCHIVNLNNESVRYSDVDGQYHQLDIKNDFVHKIIFNGKFDTISIAHPTYHGIPAIIIEQTDDRIHYKVINSGERKWIKINDIAYIDFVVLDSLKLSKYQNVLDKFTKQQYYIDYAILKSSSDNFKEVKILNIDSNQIHLSFPNSADGENQIFEPLGNVKEIRFFDLKNNTFGLNKDKTNVFNVFGKGGHKGKTIAFENDTIVVLLGNSSNEKDYTSFKKDEMVSIENKNVKKLVKRENSHKIKRISIGGGIGYVHYSLPKTQGIAISSKMEDYENKLKIGKVVNLSYSLFDTKGNGVELSYRFFSSNAETEGDFSNIFYTDTNLVTIHEHNFRHYFGVSYCYLSSTSLLDNRNIFRFSIGPGLMLNYFPIKTIQEEIPEKIKIRNTSLGFHTSIGYDIVLNSYVGLGFEIKYIFNQIKQFRMDGIPFTLSNDLSQLGHQIDLTVGLRFY